MTGIINSRVFIFSCSNPTFLLLFLCFLILSWFLLFLLSCSKGTLFFSPIHVFFFVVPYGIFICILFLLSSYWPAPSYVVLSLHIPGAIFLTNLDILLELEIERNCLKILLQLFEKKKMMNLYFYRVAFIEENRTYAYL